MVGNKLEPIAPAPQEQVVETAQVFGDKSIDGRKIGPIVDTGNAGITSVGDNPTDIRFWAGSSFANRTTAPFRVDRTGNTVISGYKLFEAVIDPAGNGDYTTIAAALTAGKKRLFLRNGAHVLSADLTISADDVSLVGESKEGVLIQSGITEAASSWRITVSGARCVLSYLTKTGVASTSVNPIYVTGSNCIIDNCVLKNTTSGNRGVYALTGVGLKVSNSRIETSLWPIYSTQDQTTVIDNYINIANGNNTGFYFAGNGGVFSRNRYTRAGTGQYGVQLSGTNWLVSDNFLYSSSTAGGLAIYVDGSINKIINNRIQGFYDGIKNAANYGITIMDNSIYSIGNNGIDLQSSTGAGYGHHITSNNTIYSAGGNGIACRYGYGHIIAGNTIYSAAANGIYADSTAAFYAAVITNNQAFYCANGFVGTQVSLTHEKTVWMGNMAYFSTSRGFNIVTNNSNIIGNINSNSGLANVFTNTGGNTQYNI